MTRDKGTTSRRAFLAGASLGLAGLRLVGASAHAEDAPPTSKPGQGLRVGVIGVGGRGQGIVRDCIDCGAEVVAVADVYEGRLNQVKQALPDVAIYMDYRRLLERGDLHGVGIATPDHWHAPIFLDAVSAGLDVYLEKPLCKTIKEARQIVKATRDYKRVVQVGNQFRSGAELAKVAEAIQGGRLGKVKYIQLWEHRNNSGGDSFSPPKSAREGQLDGRLDWEMFQGSAKKRPFDPWRYFAWRWYWDYAGGLMTDLGAHRLGLVHWMMNVDAPKSCAAHGGNFYFERWETPDIIEATWDYGDFVVGCNMQFINGIRQSGAEFLGSDASMRLLREGCELIANKDGAVLETWPFDGYSTRNHTANWLECVQTRRDPVSHIEYGYGVFVASVMANEAYLQGRRLYWDAERHAFSRRPV